MSTPTFRAAVVRTPAGPDSIEILDVPVIEPGPGEVRVRSRPRRSTPSTSASRRLLPRHWA